jgi:hydrogenase maturation factor HypF (carbamoyltransferase family)
MGNLKDLNSLTECPYCLDGFGNPVQLEYDGQVWCCPNCGEEFK